MFQVEWDEHTSMAWLHRVSSPRNQDQALSFYNNVLDSGDIIPVRNVVIREVAGQPIPAS